MSDSDSTSHVQNDLEELRENFCSCATPHFFQRIEVTHEGLTPLAPPQCGQCGKLQRPKPAEALRPSAAEQWRQWVRFVLAPSNTDPNVSDDELKRLVIERWDMQRQELQRLRASEAELRAMIQQEIPELKRRVDALETPIGGDEAILDTVSRALDANAQHVRKSVRPIHHE